ncbi:MAG: glycosyltransferase family 9 protein [Bacteroidetes bacterium]|nr:glycosyltransferase family 9 protein [Bacteroidota bacterium]
MKPPQRILVIRPDRIGDVVLATPTIRALRRNFPDAFIAALVRPATEAVLRHNPHLDDILIDDLDGVHMGKAGFIDRLRMLRRYHFNTALMLLPTERHAWMTLLAGIRTRIGVGTKLYQVLTFTRSVSRKKYIPLRHEADYCLDLARALGATDDGFAVEIFLTEEERTEARARLQSLGRNLSHPLVSVHPESGRSAPNWKSDMYRSFVEVALDRFPDAQIIVQITPANRPLWDLFEPLRSDRVLLPDNGGDLRLVMGFIAEAQTVVSASTGPMHLAAGLRVPTVSLFCPMTACHPDLWGPQGNSGITLLPPASYCAARCPGDPHVCTLEGGINIPDVLDAVEKQLTSP